MTDDDAWWLADALGENKSLVTRISVRTRSAIRRPSHRLRWKAALAIGAVLETLDLTRNAIGRDGVELMNALDENSTLSRLGLESNLIPAETTMELKRRVGLRAQCDWPTRPGIQRRHRVQRTDEIHGMNARRHASSSSSSSSS